MKGEIMKTITRTHCDFCEIYADDRRMFSCWHCKKDMCDEHVFIITGEYEYARGTHIKGLSYSLCPECRQALIKWIEGRE